MFGRCEFRYTLIKTDVIEQTEQVLCRSNSWEAVYSLWYQCYHAKGDKTVWIRDEENNRPVPVGCYEL